MERYISILLVMLFGLVGCSKTESIEEDIYGYEVDCKHCDISYLSNRGEAVDVKSHRGTWKLEFINGFSPRLEITVYSLSPVSTIMHIYILKNGNRVESQSGMQSVTLGHTVSSSGSGSTKPASSVCGAPTQKGGPCQRKVSGGGRCWQHK